MESEKLNSFDNLLNEVIEGMKDQGKIISRTDAEKLVNLFIDEQSNTPYGKYARTLLESNKPITKKMKKMADKDAQANRLVLPPRENVKSASTSADARNDALDKLMANDDMKIAKPNKNKTAENLLYIAATAAAIISLGLSINFLTQPQQQMQAEQSVQVVETAKLQNTIHLGLDNTGRKQIVNFKMYPYGPESKFVARFERDDMKFVMTKDRSFGYVNENNKVSYLDVKDSQLLRHEIRAYLSKQNETMNSISGLVRDEDINRKNGKIKSSSRDQNSSESSNGIHHSSTKIPRDTIIDTDDRISH